MRIERNKNPIKPASFPTEYNTKLIEISSEINGQKKVYVRLTEKVKELSFFSHLEKYE